MFHLIVQALWNCLAPLGPGKMLVGQKIRLSLEEIFSLDPGT